jgi:hypothetical protein
MAQTGSGTLNQPVEGLRVVDLSPRKRPVRPELNSGGSTVANRTKTQYDLWLILCMSQTLNTSYRLVVDHPSNQVSIGELLLNYHELHAVVLTSSAGSDALSASVVFSTMVSELCMASAQFIYKDLSRSAWYKCTEISARITFLVCAVAPLAHSLIMSAQTENAMRGKRTPLRNSSTSCLGI